MRKWMMGAAALLTLSISAGADVDIQEVLARREGADINIRVTVNNPGRKTQPGPVKVELYVRQTGSDSWQKIKTWTNIQKLAAGNRVSRDFFEENNQTLRSLAEQGEFEIRATASAPGAPRVAERKSSWKDTATGK